ncbi:MAG: 16S rRNA (adenine(1518)-N(6)/adenine(1519)-N(6))-dimethyltransferase RsmA [Endomicrobium sp.]|jgi:16S rRNA (adenine1518-N6/adenine1519-N6)-dimethyltransferase|nr:16S rRNA (adenine(1518)-N(6)/adenine(1519)-N(6))-dimethyltransferase RsmA [Endomicrobium sp.]
MRQKYGQNFLTDNNIAHSIVNIADLKKNDRILEIGPGKGILTKIIQPRVKWLTAVEIDTKLYRQLSYYFSFLNIKNIKIINKDFLKYDLMSMNSNTIVKNFNLNNNFKVISNLPYTIGTAIIQKILPSKNWTTSIFMLQKEVAQRITAQPYSKNYGYISIFASYYATCEILFDVSPKCFNPSPKVISSIVKLTNKKAKHPESIFFNFIKHVFNMRRKIISNGLSSFENLEKKHAINILKSCGLNPFLRPDNLSILDFMNLTKEIQRYRICRAQNLFF